jgi:hypothetical protein
VRGDDFIQAFKTVQVQFGMSLLQVHGKKQTHEPKKMIAMQMANKNALDFMDWDLKTRELHLSAFATIHQKMTIFYLQILTRRKPSIRWNSST